MYLLGFGCDTAKVVNILAHRDSTQRALIEHEYRVLYSEDLHKRLSSELSGDVKVLPRMMLVVNVFVTLIYCVSITLLWHLLTRDCVFIMFLCYFYMVSESGFKLDA